MPTTPISATATPHRALGRSLRHCPICSSADLRYEFIVDGYPVCRCAQCSLLFLNPQPAVTTNPIDRPNPEQMNSSVYELHAVNAASRLDQLMTYARVKPHRVLMIADDAFLTREARERQLDVVSLTGSEVDQGAIGALPPGMFDAAVFYCTLERLSDPEAVLKDLKRRLTAPGVVMVIGPTIDSRTARLFRSAWWEFHPQNLHYFSADTLQSLLLKCGYGDPIIDSDDSAVSLEYFKRKIPAISSGFYRRLLSLLVWATPGFLRHRAFRSLNSRRIVLARSKPVAEVPTLSVIVAAYNEKDTLRTLMDRLIAKSIAGVNIEIVLVESNSSDGTREDAQRYSGHPRVRLIPEDRPRGKGHAVRTGLAACTGDVVLFQDADLEYDIDDYDDLIAPLLAYRRNFVIGSRHVSKGRVWKIRQFNDAVPLATVFNFGHVFFLALFNFMYRQRLKDPFSMFKVFRRDCLHGLTFECNRFDFDFEIVIKLLRKGYRPLELPVNYRARSPREGKKVKMFRDPVTWIRALLKFRWGPLYTSYGTTENASAVEQES
jgi:glycosyltransferase involved in cell wall biosynthesis